MSFFLRSFIPALVVFVAGLGVDARECSLRAAQARTDGGTQALTRWTSWMAAVPQLNTRTGRCGGAFVSDQGHILTAAHCLDSCGPPPPPEGTTRETFCEVWVDGQKTRARLLLRPSCAGKDVVENQLEWHALQSQRRNGVQDSAQINERLSEVDHCREQGDIAVILPDRVPTNFQCLPLASEEPRIGTSVSSIGFPIASQRPNAPTNFTGRSIAGDDGHVIMQSSCQERVYEKTGRGRPPRLVYRDRPLLQMEALNERFIQTTVDILEGSSGGPLVNEKGEIVGVASNYMMIAHGTRRNCPGSTLFERLGYLRKMADEQNARAALSQLSCQSRRVNRSGPAPR